MQRVLVISPHPDDESIGCGGTLRKHIVEGDVVDVVFLTSGERGGHGLPPDETALCREAEAQSAAAILGVRAIEFYHEPDGDLAPMPTVVGRLRSRLEEWRPSIVYLPHERESHADHRAAVEIVRGAAKGLNPPPAMFMYEVWTPLEQIDLVVDISPFVEIKRTAIRAHESQCAQLDFEQAILGLNRYRGEMHCWPGGDYAEVFSRLVI